jgi:hypothetical protein
MSSLPRTRTSYMAHRNGEEPDADDPLLDFKPAPHVAPRRNSIGPERQRAFIMHLAACGIVNQAAKHIGASLEALYKLRHKPGADEFAAAWDKAVDRGVSRIEDGALQRAIEGVEKPIVSGGKLLGWYRVHNEALVMFLLRQRRSQHYATIPQLALRPGHPLYERIKQEVLDEHEGDEEEVRASLDKFLDGLRERRLANEKLLAELDAADEAAEAGNDLDTPPVDEGSKSESDMTDRQEKRGEQRIDERDPEAEREPQEEARRNNAQSVDKEGRDINRDGSESDA